MVTAAGDEPMMPLQSYTLWSIWLYLPFLLRLFFLVLALVSFYTLFSAAVTMVRLRSLSDKRHVEDESSLHRSLAALDARSTNLRQLVGATFFLFGIVFFLKLPFILVTPESNTPVYVLVFDNLQRFFAVAYNAFLVFMVLHCIQWFVSGRVHATAMRLNTKNIA